MATHRARTRSYVKYSGGVGHRSSAVRKNFKAAASSRKPIVTLIMFIQSPLLGSFLSRLGNRARTKNGEANAVANASAPRASSRVLKLPDAAIPLNPPRNGATQVKLTIVNETAMNTVPMYPPFPARSVVTLASELGSVISNSPNRLSARTTNRRPSKTFVYGSTASRLNVVNSVRAATERMTTIVTAYTSAWASGLVPSFWLCFKKMLTVIGTIGKTQGVNRVMIPNPTAVARKRQRPASRELGGGSWSRTALRSAAWSRFTDRRWATAFGSEAGIVAGGSFPFRGGSFGDGVGGSSGGPLVGDGRGEALPIAFATASRYFESTSTAAPDTFTVASTGTLRGGRQLSSWQTSNLNCLRPTFFSPGVDFGETTARNSQVAPSG